MTRRASKRSTVRGARLLTRVRAFMFDIDGTLTALDPRSHQLVPLPGAIELIEALRLRRIPYVFVTNGTLHSTEDYLTRLNRIGLPVTAAQWQAILAMEEK